MKIPNNICVIEMFCMVNPSEDPNKIKKAISNIFPYSTIITEDSSIVAQSKDLNSLEKIFEIIHSRQSQKNYKRNLEKNLEHDTTWFYLNKQAAFVGKIAICEQSEESPLGPIKVVLTSSNIDKIIEWLVLGNDTIS
ncbi:RNA-binding domain-containing protein [Nitrosopumilus sp.]|uniref:RNA-binding domain-containing protein n=1 Tax=Nitrosopumilus sp. TaxID=2024843 RepID=UPI00292F5587|nr:RNA-binding domain-containing protein [Nitrosopumilus sp.]